MLTSGDVVDLDLGAPAGRDAGFQHPAVVVTAQRILESRGNVGPIALTQIRETIAVLLVLPM